MIRYGMIHVTAIGFTPSGSSTVHIYTKNIEKPNDTNNT